MRASEAAAWIATDTRLRATYLAAAGLVACVAALGLIPARERHVGESAAAHAASATPHELASSRRAVAVLPVTVTPSKRITFVAARSLPPPASGHEPRTSVDPPRIPRRGDTASRASRQAGAGAPGPATATNQRNRTVGSTPRSDRTRHSDRPRLPTADAPPPTADMRTASLQVGRGTRHLLGKTRHSARHGDPVGSNGGSSRQAKSEHPRFR